MLLNTIKVTFLVSILSLPAASFALTDAQCKEKLAPVNERIESGKYSERNVNVAKQMRASLVQSCAFLDEATMAQMMEGFEQLLPTRSAEEQKAVEDKKREERRAQRDVQRAEAKARKAAREKNKVVEKKLPVPEIFQQPPTGKIALAGFVERDSPMDMVRILDFDLYKGTARVLYSSRPSRDQYGHASAKTTFYVVTTSADGSQVQNIVGELPMTTLFNAKLVPGRDELVTQSTLDRDKGSTISRWSVSGGKELSSVAAPKLPWSKDKFKDHDLFKITTGDGNLLFVATLSKADKSIYTAWLKMTPDGKTLGQGKYVIADTIAFPENWFRTPMGAGIVTSVHKRSGGAIESDFEQKKYTEKGVEITADVAFEKRVLILGSNVSSSQTLPALDRMFIWMGLENLPYSEETLDDMQKFGDFQLKENIKHGNSTRAVRLSFDGLSRDAITAIKDHYAILLNNSGSKRLSDSYGFTLAEYSTSDQINSTYLQPAAEHLGVRFESLHANGDDKIYVFGRGAKDYVLRLDAKRKIEAYAKASLASSVYTNGLLADANGVWIIGYGRKDAVKQYVWIERVQF